ncbi:MAG: leucyl/phenylalanyl-tRNA--protein transferase [Lachnospiraceae bacterium]|nr:leucyl/phenylalanyl-tRNA--protein transferase [Lachnospiraceae bacterium]
MPVYLLSKDHIRFPKPTLAEKDGLLAVGGDLSKERLLLAYSYGIFPWFNPEEDILWWCPKERFVIFPEEIHISKSMHKFMKKHDVTMSINRDFRDTMHRCRMMRENKEGTWITDDMENAYYELHKDGYAVSVEAYIDGELAGGLYGVTIGRCFFGESMFSEKENGSKLALIGFSQYIRQYGFLFIDCQFRTDHLATMGGRYISWEEYDRMLAVGIGREME